MAAPVLSTTPALDAEASTAALRVWQTPEDGEAEYRTWLASPVPKRYRNNGWVVVMYDAAFNTADGKRFKERIMNPYRSQAMRIIATCSTGGPGIDYAVEAGIWFRAWTRDEEGRHTEHNEVYWKLKKSHGRSIQSRVLTFYNREPDGTGLNTVLTPYNPDAKGAPNRMLGEALPVQDRDYNFLDRSFRTAGYKYLLVNTFQYYRADARRIMKVARIAFKWSGSMDSPKKLYIRT